MHAGSATKQPVKRVSKYFNFNNRERDKAFGFLFVYNYFHQFSNNTFLSVASELDAGFALFCFWRRGGKFIVYNYYYDVSRSPSSRCDSGAK